MYFLETVNSDSRLFRKIALPQTEHDLIRRAWKCLVIDIDFTERRQKRTKGDMRERKRRTRMFHQYANM